MKCQKAVDTLQNLAQSLQAKGTPIQEQDKRNNVSAALSFLIVYFFLYRIISNKDIKLLELTK